MKTKDDIGKITFDTENWLFILRDTILSTAEVRVTNSNNYPILRLVRDSGSKGNK